MSNKILSNLKLTDLPKIESGLGWQVGNIRWGGMNINYSSNIPAGFDSAPYFKGLAGDLCQSAHWGYLIRGRLLVRYPDREEIVEAGSVFYMPPGHSVYHLEETEMIEFSPEREIDAVKQVWRANISAQET